ncbi:MAG: RNA polymerase sigma factor [Solirubrobacteraceae bacterium]
MSAIAATEPDPVFTDLQEVGELYAARAERVRQQVRTGVRAPDAVIEDACQFAWSRLMHNRLRVRRRTAQAWLVSTAVHEALRLVHRQGRDLPLDGLLDQACELAPLGAGPTIDELVQQRARLESIGGLPERQQRMLWLRALGLSYAEIAELTGDSPRTVERQLVRARRELRRRELSGTGEPPG